MIQMSKTPAQYISAALAEWRTSGDRPRLLLDFSRIQFLTSEFLNALILLQTGRLCQPILCNLSVELQEVFQITRLNRVFEIRPRKATGVRLFL